MRVAGLQWIMILLLVTAALAGCTSSPDGDQGPEGEPSDNMDGDGDDNGDDDGVQNEEDEHSATTWAYGGCTAQQAVFFPPKDGFDFLPEGFSPAQGPDPAGQTTIVLTLIFDCGNMTSASTGELRDVLEAHLYLVVDPPSEYQDSEMANYLFHVLGVVSHGELRDLFDDAGISIDDGSVSYATQSLPFGHTSEAEVQSWLDFEVRTVIEGTESAGEPFQVRTFGFNDTADTVSHMIDFDVGERTVAEGTAKFSTTDTGDPQIFAMLNTIGTGLAIQEWDVSFTLTAHPVET